MLLTDDFVLLNYPRTGSTFARAAVRELYARRSGRLGRALQRLGLGSPGAVELELSIERTAAARRAGRRSQHGALSQIPASHRGKPVVSITRHPLDRAVSMYEHGFWREHPPGDLRTIRARFPRFPQLGFSDFLTLGLEFDLPNALQGVPLAAEVGPHTVHFVRFYAADPDAALRSLTDAAIEGGTFLERLPPVRFLHTEHLLEELTAFLQELGFGPEETAFLRQQPRVNVAGARQGRPWSDYFTPEEERAFRARERLLFRAFPEYA